MRGSAGEGKHACSVRGERAVNWRRALPLVVCPRCRDQLNVIAEAGEDQAILGHTRVPCDEVYPVIDDIPRLVTGSQRSVLRRAHSSWFEQDMARDRFGSWGDGANRSADDDVVARFDQEWHLFDDAGKSEHEIVFASYFDLVRPQDLAGARMALDAGCGAGRWALEVARRGVDVIAVDLGLSIEVAERNTRSTGRVLCVQADLAELPLQPQSMDFAYSLGVLHHVGDTKRALARLVDVLKPGRTMLIYLYYALENRSRPYRLAFRISDRIRRWTSTLPQPLLTSFATAVAALAYFPLARAARLLRQRGYPKLASALPLGFYADLSFRMMRNDSLDRFGTAVEKRYTRDSMRALLEDAGLADVAFSPDPPYWHAIARRQTVTPIGQGSSPT